MLRFLFLFLIVTLPSYAQLAITHTKVSSAPATSDPNDIDSADWNAGHTITGQLALSLGGTSADLSATGGASQIVKQSSLGGALSVGLLVAGEIPVLDASKITTGAFSDAQISESSVTQHEAALAIAATQVTSGSFGDARIDNLNTLASGLTINRCVEVDGSGFLAVASGACATAAGSGITSLNGLTIVTQTFAVGTSGTDINISSVSPTHTFNFPSASGSARGPLTSADWTTFNSKQAGDADLTALSALASTGITVRTAADTWAQRTIVSAGTTVTITNPGGVAGNIDLAVNQPALTLSSLGGAVIDAQVPDLNTLSTGLTISRCVETDGSGNLVSAAALCGTGGGTPGGSDTHVQVNTLGAFGGTARFTFIDASSTVNIGDGGTSNVQITLNPSGATYNPTLSAVDAAWTFNTTATTELGSQAGLVLLDYSPDNTTNSSLRLHRSRLDGPVLATAVLPDLDWSAVNSASLTDVVARVRVTLDDATDGSVDATVDFSTMVADTLTARLSLTATGVNATGTLSQGGTAVSLAGHTHPVSTDITGLGTGVATFLATPSSANLAAAVTDETGTGAVVLATSPALVTPDLDTPSALNLANATGLTAAQVPIKTDGGLGIDTGELVTDPVAVAVQLGAARTFGDNTLAQFCWDMATSGSSDVQICFKDGEITFSHQLTLSGPLVLQSSGEGISTITGFPREHKFGLRTLAALEADQSNLWRAMLPQKLIKFGCQVTGASGTVTFNMTRDDGTPANLFSSNYTATETWSTICADSATQVLGELDFATHALWDVTGDCVDTGGNIVYTHSGGTCTITQTEANQASAPADGARNYRFEFDIASATGDADCTITTAFAGSSEDLDITNGTDKLHRFLGSATPGDFVLSCTSASGGFTLDNVSLRAAPCDYDLIDLAEDDFAEGEGWGYDYVSDVSDPTILSCTALTTDN